MSAVSAVGKDYLEQAAELTADVKLRSYERMEIQPGNAVLDVGCGPGIDTVALARRIGRAGRVVGIDHDEAMVSQAIARADEAGVAAWVEHRVGTATALDLPDDSFDAVRSERLFQHLADPAPALAEMIRVTRPGGRVVVVDTDWGSHSADCADVSVERALPRTLAETSLANGYSGRQLYRLMKRAGLAQVDVTTFPLQFTDYAFWRTIARTDEVEANAVAEGAVIRDALAPWRDRMSEAGHDGAFFATVNMVLASGIKPTP
jgi:ubiquinone/menaquinone biosynthesis C-methylase UbiE